jgi:glycerophosphoryl diester phosphodiesterase
VNAARVVRIAHAHGNRRESIQRAMDADVDMIEADVWYRSGDICVRHEERVGWLPVLADRRPRGVRAIGPYALPLGRRFYLRLDVDRLPLSELLATVSGKKRLLIDVKESDASKDDAFARTLARQIDEHDAAAWVAVCGQFWPVLDRLAEIAPHLELRYSMQRPSQWDAYQRRLAEGRSSTSVCIQHRLIDQAKAAFLEEHGVDTYCWTVDDAAEAAVLVQRGVDGIISNHLELLEALPQPPRM